jgi:hypothetical protein
MGRAKTQISQKKEKEKNREISVTSDFVILGEGLVWRK